MTTNGWVVVTGASRGIGRAIAVRLAGSGFGVVLWARSAPELRQLAAEIAGRGGSVRYATVDVADPGMVAGAAAELRDLGCLKAVVVNAGQGTWRPFLETTLGQWQGTLAVNLDGAFHTLRALLPLVLRSRDGQLVAIASDSSLYPFPGRAPYCASKTGLKALLDALRLEVREHGVRTTVLLPSRVDTHFGGKRPGDRPAALRPEDVAQLVHYVLTVPPHVEIRELHVGAITESYGPFEEKLAYDGRPHP